MKRFKIFFTKQNIKSFTKVFSFLLVFVVLLQTLSVCSFSKTSALTYKNRFSKAYNFLSEPQDSIQIAAIGSSDLFSAFVPMRLYEQYGYTSTVISSSHQTAAESYGYLTELLKTQNPKLLVIETDMFYENAPKFNPKNKRNSKLSNARSKALNFFDAFTVNRFEDAITSHFTIFRFHNKWKLIGSKNSGKNKTDSQFVNIDHGHNFNNSVKPGIANDNMKKTDISEPIPDETLATVNKMIEVCTKKGIKVLFVEMPSQNSWNYYRHNAVQNLADSNNIEFIDFNLLFKQVGFDISKDYRDGGDHCNFYGATKITLYLGNVFKEKYSYLGLSDCRNNPSYSYWDESNAEFKERYKVN
ncbi:MAG: hypothetical protein LUG21_05630 [Clostridiales bacterium]|nr:hypothetical protein [Clostridiales bacterium]